VHLFGTTADVLEEGLTRYRPLITTDGMVWASWHKRSSGAPTDLSDQVVRDLALASRYMDVKVCAVDAMWPALKLVIPVSAQ